MQNAYISALLELAEKDCDVIHLLADSGTGYDEMFKKNFPSQIIDVGICEQNLVGIASGLAACGKKPFAFTAGAFLAYRAYEFIRDDVCLQNRNVKIVGMGSGLSWSTLGATHHTTEDLSVLRSIPNLKILSPASPIETYKAVYAAYECDGPVYIRIGMNREEEIYKEDYSFTIGKNICLKGGKDITVFSTGSIISEVMKAATLLEQEGIDCEIINIHTIKPFDETSVLEAAENKKMFFVVEEHNKLGGLGSAIAETLTKYGKSVRIKEIALNDVFAKGYGTLNEVRTNNGLDAQSIYEEIINERIYF